MVIIDNFSTFVRANYNFVSGLILRYVMHVNDSNKLQVSPLYHPYS